MLAAAALYALEHQVARLEEDHANARRLADGIARTEGLRLDPQSIDTNMLYFRVAPALGTAAEFVERLRNRGVLMLTTGSGRHPGGDASGRDRGQRGPGDHGDSGRGHTRLTAMRVLPPCPSSAGKQRTIGWPWSADSGDRRLQSQLFDHSASPSSSTGRMLS